VLAEKLGKTPAELDRLTISEIEVLLRDPGKHEIAGDQEINERLAAWRRLTPRQKLERGHDD
jgi:hypothetical protein